jgi:hypothetical protein
MCDPIIPEFIKYNEKTFTLLSDHNLIGGTKFRLLMEIIPTISEKELVYAGPETGLAQVALAYACKFYGKKATIFVQAPFYFYPPLSLMAEHLGATIFYSKQGRTLKDTQDEAAFYQSHCKGSILIPFGLKSPEYSTAFEIALKHALSNIQTEPKRLWLVAGSGFILQVLKNIYPNCHFMVVQVGKKIWPDQLGPNDKLFISPFKFVESATKIPPWPTINWYDAKVWEFVIEHGQEGDYIWNVGTDKVHNEMTFYNDICLLVEYKRVLVDRVTKFICSKNKLPHNIPIIKKFVKDCYIKWIFEANNNKKLDEHYFPKENIILQSDINYLCKMIHIPEILMGDFDINIKSKFLMPIVPINFTFLHNMVTITIGLFKFNLSNVQWKLLKKRYKSDSFENDCAKMILMYAYLDTPNELLSLPPPILEKFNVDHECFGSPLNTTLDNYCSAWPGLEEKFGSCGNFFDFTFTSGKTFTISPPADLNLMNLAIDKMLNALDNLPDLKFIVDVPVWDPETQKTFSHQTGYNFKNNTEPFEGVTKILSSKYLKSKFVMGKEYKFYNYFTDSYVPVVPTHVFIVSNCTVDYTAQDVAKAWKESC